MKLAPGMDLPVLVKDDALIFPAKGVGTEVRDPILRHEVLPKKNSIDWSKTAGEYFSMQCRHLSETLDLTADQQIQLNPSWSRNRVK